MAKPEARVVQLQKDLMKLEMFESLQALNWMLRVMNANNGYSRKDGSNYYYHLVDATQDLINHGERDEVTITGTILHDAVEDIEGVTLEDIEKEYGREVAYVVSLVTKKKHIDYKNPENVRLMLVEILQDVRASKIKTADRKHNFSTLDATSASHEARQASETEQLFIPFFKEARKKYPEHSAYFHSAKTAIVPHLKRIKKAIAAEEKMKSKMEELEMKLENERKRNNALERKIKMLGVTHE